MLLGGRLAIPSAWLERFLLKDVDQVGALVIEREILKKDAVCTKSVEAE